MSLFLSYLEKKIASYFLIITCIFYINISLVQAEQNLSLPRFVSLKSDEVNVRTGPGPEYPIEWILKRVKMPVEILMQFGAWRRIRDFEGAEGWVHQSMLAGLRTVIITEEKAILRKSPQETAPGIFQLEVGVIAKLLECQSKWCRLYIEDYKGWLPRHQLWGVNSYEFQK